MRGGVAERQESGFDTRIPEIGRRECECDNVA